MKHFFMWAYVRAVRSTIIKSQTVVLRASRWFLVQRVQGWGCFLFSSSALFFSSAFFSRILRVLLLLLSLPAWELRYYQQSAFKSAPAQHQDVFCMLILRDTDPSLLRHSLMLAVPETAGKTVSAQWSAHTMGISGHNCSPTEKSMLVQKCCG